MTQGLLGDGFNRWFNKGTQFIITKNGTSAHILEHSYIYGMTPQGLQEFLNIAIEDYQAPISDGTNAYHPDNLLPPKLGLVTSPEIDLHIEHLRRSYIELSSQREYILHHMTEFGKDF